MCARSARIHPIALTVMVYVLILTRSAVDLQMHILYNSPSCKSRHIVIAVIDLEVVAETGGVILNVEIQEVQADPLTILNTDVPVADLLVLVFLGVPRRVKHLPGVCVDSSTFFCCQDKR